MAYHELRDGTRVFYTDSGHGRPVLLLHGWTCDGNDWSWQAPELERRGYRVIAVDHRGHGRSDVPASGAPAPGAPTGSFQAQVLADDAAALLRAVAPGEAAVVFGHSMGSIIASALEVRHPDLVEGLVLVDAMYNIPEEIAVATVAAVRGPAPKEVAWGIFDQTFYTPDTPAFLKAWHRRRIQGTPDHVVAGCIIDLYEGHEALGRAVIAQDYLRQRKVPRLAVYASEQAAWLERALPAGESDEIHVLEGGHFLHQQLPDQFNALMLGWLEKVAS